jgi:DNA ligase D-like protein (predicted 3'-phosphoesterase)
MQGAIALTVKPTKRNHKSGADAQAGLFFPNPPFSSVPESGDQSRNHSDRQHKSLEEIRAHNRTVISQPYVLKHHRTKKPHYDLRLGHNGLLKSWAMSFPPSYCPDHRRAATQVEDHLRAHMSFEGIFPEGKPGAGLTMVVDTGMWEPLPEYSDVEDSLRRGCLKFRLCGTLLKGVWTLTRQEQGPASGPNPVWCLTKEPDAFMMSEEKANRLFEAEPVSILTKRTMKEIEREWNEGKDKGEPEPALFDV